MGAGRKKETFTLEEKTPKWTMNCSAPARNLRKSELGGVIFGCKHCTFNECMAKQLFGLPAPHFAYVKNVTPGMPLFLFNYSDRRLHGIFEAASPGQMNINQWGWTLDGSGTTPYPAQVRFKIQLNCQPLSEDQFKRIIAGNYYEQSLFWFELDKAQTKQLISLFSRSPESQSVFVPHPQSATRESTMFRRSPAPTASLGGCDSGVVGVDANSSHTSISNIVCRSSNDPVLHDNDDQEFGTFTRHEAVTKHGSSSRFLPQKKWSSLFKHLDSASRNEGKSADTLTSEGNIPIPNQMDKKCETFWDTPFCGENQANQPFEDLSDMEWGSSYVAPDLCGENLSLEVPLDADATKILEDQYILKQSVDGSTSSATTKEINSASSDDENPASLPAKANREHKFPTEEMILEMRSSDLQSLVDQAQSKNEIKKLKGQCKALESGSSLSSGHVREEELEKSLSPLHDSILIVGGYNGSSWLSALDSYSPSHDLMESLKPMRSLRSYASAAILNDELYVFGGGDGSGTLWHDTVESYNRSSDQWFSRPSLNRKKGSLAGASLRGKIFAIGGGDGIDCFSEVEMLDLNIGKWITTRSMLQKVELACYALHVAHAPLCPFVCRHWPLITSSVAPVLMSIGWYLILLTLPNPSSPGALSGAPAPLRLKLVLGPWPLWALLPIREIQPLLLLQPGMIPASLDLGPLDTLASWGLGLAIRVFNFASRCPQSRFAPAAVELGGVLYVVGGYDGHEYLKYAIGGYDGDRMISSVEVFDPRIGSWTMADSMNEPRGYMGAVTIRNSIYAIGGIQNDNKISNSVEQYSDGHGWEVTNLKAVGKRCFFSAVVV
ncbi:hypothetical protein Nepgr_015156 [Nepenthes gracilis]|uniref:DCD domain-containing protein n=1 Tax=Nepenthes gracilis TaxID=150966 RepID=A0AAD3SMB2_NEPGR|nr:hypothetical protein Nepgr_015156 [Nepenthes gracilis]